MQGKMLVRHHQNLLLGTGFVTSAHSFRGSFWSRKQDRANQVKEPSYLAAQQQLGILWSLSRRGLHFIDNNQKWFQMNMIFNLIGTAISTQL